MDLLQKFPSRAPKRWLLAGVTAMALAGVGLGPGAGLAAAHDSVIASNPENGGTVDAFPDEIVLTFSGEPREGFNTLAVTNSETKEVLFDGEPTVTGRDVAIEVPAEVADSAGPGEYTVGFQITSSDGHATRGSTSFTVAGEAPAATEAPSDAAVEAAGETSTNPWPWAIGIIVIVAVLAVVITTIVKRRQQK